MTVETWAEPVGRAGYGDGFVGLPGSGSLRLGVTARKAASCELKTSRDAQTHTQTHTHIHTHYGSEAVDRQRQKQTQSRVNMKFN